MLQLNHPLILAYLRSDGLQARGEDSMLMVADWWVSGPQGAACTDAQLRQVAEVVRLGQLSHTFAFDVLPELWWV